VEASREVIRVQNLAEQERSERELTLAQQTQESLLPRCLPHFENYGIHAFSRPTRYVGGDFYDFLQLRSGDWMGVLADVSGKGIPAALLSSMVLGALSTAFHSGAQPDEALNSVNKLLCEKSLPFQFVTLFLFVLNPDGRGQFISAGHNPIYLFRAATGTIEKLISEAFVLGMFDDAVYQSRSLHLDNKDLLVVYSDGLTDAENPQEERFGASRLRDIIRKEAPAGGQALEQAILEAVAEYTQGMPQTDDITFLIVERRDAEVA